MTGTYELAEQRGGKGYYGKVLVEVEPDDTTRGCEITFDETHVKNKEWRDAAKFGIEYAYSHIPRKEFLSKGHRVRVRLLQGHPFDTDGLTIAYAAIRAVLNAFGKNDPEWVSFDVDGGKMVFEMKKTGFVTGPRDSIATAPEPVGRHE